MGIDRSSKKPRCTAWRDRLARDALLRTLTEADDSSSFVISDEIDNYPTAEEARFLARQVSTAIDRCRKLSTKTSLEVWRVLDVAHAINSSAGSIEAGVRGYLLVASRGLYFSAAYDLGAADAMMDKISSGTDLTGVARRNASIRHAQHREWSDELRKWYAENMHLFASKEEATEAASKLFDLEKSTIRRKLQGR